MSNPIESFLKSIKGQQGQQSQAQAVTGIQPIQSQATQPTPVQARPVIDTLPTPPQQPQPQPLPPMIPAGQSIVEGMLTELSRLSNIERAIIASALGFDMSFKNIDIEDWAKLIEERIGKPYAEAFRRWVKLKFSGETQ